MTREPPSSDAAQLKPWVAARVAAAKRSEREIVKVPLARHGEWGCDCPNWYIGTSLTSNSGGEWLAPILPKTFDQGSPAVGRVWVVDGYFTGKSKSERGSPGKANDQWEFVVLRGRPGTEAGEGGDPDGQVAVVLGGAEAKREVPPLNDDRPWLVVIASVPLLERGSERQSAKLRDALAAAGFSEAEVIDSRQAPMLFCCYRVILAGRFATSKAANAAVEQAKKKGFSAYPRRGW